MTKIYHVYSIRLGDGIDQIEGRFATEDEALQHLSDLRWDFDCILAEVQIWPDGRGFQEIAVLAQAERNGDDWLDVAPPLRIRTRAGEAVSFMRAYISDNSRTR